jgi:hypothetical protein
VQRRGKAAALLDEFVASRAKTAEVKDHSESFALSLRKSVREKGYPVKVLVRGDRIFLERA